MTSLVDSVCADCQGVRRRVNGAGVGAKSLNVVSTLGCLSYCGAHAKLGSIKLLQSVLADICGEEQAREILSVVVGVYDLRTGDDHPTTSKIEYAFFLARIDRSQSPLRQAKQLIESYAFAIWRVGKVLYNDLHKPIP